VLIGDEAPKHWEKCGEIRIAHELKRYREDFEIVLSGSRKLEPRLKRPQLRQLRQRIRWGQRRSVQLEENKFYLTQRLRIAGLPTRSCFRARGGGFGGTL